METRRVHPALRLFGARRSSRKRVAVSPALKGPTDKSARGSVVKPCVECGRHTRHTKETIHNGLQLLRVRYGLPYSELPDCKPGDLSRFLSFLLLQGKERTSVAFPRRQGSKDKFGLCSLQRLGRYARWELAHSCASIKRNLPLGCRHHTPSGRSAWEQNAFSQPPPSSPEYLAHVRRVATRLFPSCWDRHYPSFVGKHVPNSTAREPKKSRADVLWQGRRKDYLNACLQETEVAPLFLARYKEVPTSGKCRPLLIYDESVDLLAPLHHLMYSHLKRTTDWLLCGPPTEARMTSVCTEGYQTSVDLVSATDGLRHDVSEALLDAAFFNSVEVPRSIRALAKASLSPLVEGIEGGYKRVTHGQMMGSYLSFPLLCLHSYCAASWAARFDVNARFLVNGDDVVISASRDVTVQDYPSGYRLNNDKTIRAENVAEVNSTVFLRMKGRWREVRHLRRGGALSDWVGMMHMAEAVSSSRAWTDAFSRARIGRRWGFLPSQLGHRTYASWLREKQMLRSRHHTTLPVGPLAPVNASLRVIRGRDARPLEVEALRDFMWTNGRDGGLKRDVFSPSCGKIRRTYAYWRRPVWSSFSFVGWRGPKCEFFRRKNSGFFLLPEEFDTDEEGVGLLLLDQWRYAFDSRAKEGD
jgi:hypothetical protein